MSGVKYLAFRGEVLDVIWFHVDGLGVLDGELGVSMSAALAVIRSMSESLVVLGPFSGA